MGEVANIVGLKGFSRWGAIDQYFDNGFFPSKRNWKQSDFREVAIATRGEMGDRDYILVCFSDGGTIGHNLAHFDGNCVGLIAHSATFKPPNCELRNIPTLILSTHWDITGMGRESDRAYEYYRKNNPDQWIEKVRLDRKTWHGHEFANGLHVMGLWVLYTFGMRLPIR